LSVGLENIEDLMTDIAQALSGTDEQYGNQNADREGSMITLHGNGQAQSFDGDPSMPVLCVAAVIEAAVDEKGNVTAPRVDIAVDCGPIVNPDRVRSQFEGALVMGLGVGLLNEISFKQGRVQQSNLDDDQVLRISDAPRETHVYIVPSYDMHMGGVGEPACRQSRRRSSTRSLRRAANASAPAARTAVGKQGLSGRGGAAFPARPYSTAWWALGAGVIAAPNAARRPAET
jgi:Molybdopterin-binding domain of aldehyde dehydrogenase